MTEPLLDAVDADGALATAIERVDPVADACVMEVDGSGLRLAAVDDDNVVMVEVVLDAAAFARYDARTGRIGIDVSRTLASLRDAGDGERVGIGIGADGTELRLRRGVEPADERPGPSDDDAATDDPGRASEANAGSGDSPRVADLVAALASEEPERREAALDRVRESGERVRDERVVDAVLDRLEDDDAAVRAAACRALGALGVERAREDLRRLRLSDDVAVSEAARDAVRELSSS